MKKTHYSLPIIHLLFLILLSSCSLQKQIGKSARQVIGDSALQTAHVGISIYEPATGKYWYNYQGDHYFVPASNTKIPTCYAAMKYLGDSLVGLRYTFLSNNILLIKPAGDPSFLHPEFLYQPVYDFLKHTGRAQIILCNPGWHEKGLGSGWSWDDYADNYMAERSFMPVYGNLVRFKNNGKQFMATPKYFTVENEIKGVDISQHTDSTGYRYNIKRSLNKNDFSVYPVKDSVTAIEMPFVTEGIVPALLKDTLGRNIIEDYTLSLDNKKAFVIHSQPTDSLLKPMMHRSDNFFAEQSLLMVSNELLGYMKEEAIIDTLLKTDFKDLPQKPRWVDGSGLSRYNLFSPQDFVTILHKMKNEFGMDRIRNIFETGGTGTISNYYKAEQGTIFGKTGTLSGVVAFSGFLYTKKRKLLIFSTLVNNHNHSATSVRRAIEKFLEGIRNKY